MKSKQIAYWVTTTLIALETLTGGVTNLMHGGTMLVRAMNDWPEDEYDAYLMPMYSIFRQHKGEVAVSAYLAQVYEYIMGSRLPAEKFAEPAQKFLQIDVSQDEIHHLNI